MRARFIDLPSEKLPHAVYSPAYWDAAERGRPVEIDPSPFPYSSSFDFCGEPHFQILSHVGIELPPGYTCWCVCACLIELDESALDTEIEAMCAVSFP